MSETSFAGVWKLISCDAIRKNGGAVPIYGRHPIGRLHYDDRGNMSVHIMKSGRPRTESKTKFAASPDEMRLAYEGYEAYFSTYTVDAARGKISHRVIGSLFPNWTGSAQDRYYRFENKDRLILSTEPIGAAPQNDTVVTLVWERVS